MSNQQNSTNNKQPVCPMCDFKSTKPEPSEAQKIAKKLLMACWSNSQQEVHEYIQILKKLNNLDLLNSYKNEHGWTPIFFTVVNGNVQLLRTLIEHGASIHVANDAGWYPIHYAAGYAQVEVLNELLKNGASLECKNELNGWTPLHRAVHWGRVDGIKHLLNLGADVNAKNKEGKTPKDVVKIEAEEVEKILQEHMKKISA